MWWCFTRDCDAIAVDQRTNRHSRESGNPGQQNRSDSYSSWRQALQLACAGLPVWLRQVRAHAGRPDAGANAGEFFPIIHTLFSNIKAWLKPAPAEAGGTHHGVSAEHLPRYLREWSYRFNRRNLPDGLDGYLIRRAIECATITYDQLKAGATLGGANRVRRFPAIVGYPALTG